MRKKFTEHENHQNSFIHHLIEDPSLLFSPFARILLDDADYLQGHRRVTSFRLCRLLLIKIGFFCPEKSKFQNSKYYA